MVGVIIQARMTSSRLPGKVLMDLCGKPVLQRVVERVKQAKLVDKVVVACTTNHYDDLIVNFCDEVGYDYFRGSEEDVLLRVLEAAKAYNIDTIVEITADCPLIDWNHIDQLIRLHGKGEGTDITGNIVGERTFPRGYDIRVFNTKTLERVNKEVDNPIDRQHVSTWMYLNPKGKQNYIPLNWLAPKDQNRPDLEVTLDTEKDYELLQWIFSAGQDYKLDLTCEEVVNLLTVYPQQVVRVTRKDYLEELNECYSKMEKKEMKKDEGTDNRSRESGSTSRLSRLRKRAQSN